STTADAGTHSYTVTASNSVNTVTSDAASVTINIVNPTITTQPPAALAVNYGQSVTITAGFSGSAPLSYQWYNGTTLIPGATGTSYTIPAATGASAGNYHVVVTNAGNSVTSTDSVVSVLFGSESTVFTTNFSTDTLNDTAALITSNSTSWFVMASKNVSTGTNVGAGLPLTIKFNAVTTSGIAEAAGRFSNSALSLIGNGSYLRVTTTFTARNLLTLAFGLYNSNGVAPVPLMGVTAADTLSSGGTTGVGLGTQGWVGYRASISASDAVASIGTRPSQIPGATATRGNDLVFNVTTSSFANPVGVAVGVTPANASAITFTDDAAYTLTYTITHTASNQYNIGYRLYTGATATGTPIFVSEAATTDAAALPSALTSGFDSVAIGMRNINDGSIPQIVLSSLKVDYVESAVAGVAPAITTQPTAQTVAVGAPLTLTAAASGTPTPTYQWYLDNNAISGATNATYSVGAAAAGNAGSYKVVATNGVSSATSNSVTVTVGSALTPYQTWSAAKGLTTGFNDGVSQDPDNDGIKNLLEFALNGDPLAASTSVLPVATASGGNVVLTYDIQDAALASYTITPESSTDLATWNTVVHGVASATIVQTVVNATTSHVVVTIPASGTRTFLRVKVAPTP
ncbi:MAG: hypothetical protein RIQ79_1121, partial [Verrucomicrobiota bacterium]